MSDSDEIDLDNYEEPAPPWTLWTRKEQAAVPSLVTLCCSWLARYLHAIESLDALPPHLASEVRAAIERDRRLLSDDGLGVWLDAVLGDESRARNLRQRLSLRWASALGDEGLRQFAASQAHRAERLLWLDLAYCEGIGDCGLMALCPHLPALETVCLTGCRRCGDATFAALGQHCRGLTELDAQLLTRLTDCGVQA